MTLLWLPGPPPPEEQPWPTLGPQVIEFIEEHLVYGPGDLQGEPYRLSNEQKGLLCSIYEVYPDDHQLAGRRRYKRVVLSLAKGLAKTEFAALIAICEASPSAPVRTLAEDGEPVFDGQGTPIGASVTDPYIPMVAYTEEQTEELAYGAVKSILENSDLAAEFDIGLERIKRLDGDGEMKALASSPNARDGARTTFQHFDETHRFFLPNLKRAHQTMLNNIPKRRAADAWTLETTTSFAPGERSIAEEAHEYARKVAAGQLSDAGIFYFHREAGQQHDLKTKEGRRAAVVEASGPSGMFRDVEAVVNLYDEPGTDKAYWERVWLNRPVQAERKAFDMDAWSRQARPGEGIEAGALVGVFFDGSRFDDATGISVRDIETGLSIKGGLWERPQGPAGEDWEVPEDEVDAVMTEIFERYDVWRLYCDPPKWESTVSRWAGRWGSDRVIAWHTSRRAQMAHAVQEFITDLEAGNITNDGDPDVARHVGNACRSSVPYIDPETEQPLFLIQKERPDSPFKIDLAVCEVGSNKVRNDAIASGALERGGWIVR